MQHSSHCVEMALLLDFVCIFTAIYLQYSCGICLTCVRYYDLLKNMKKIFLLILCLSTMYPVVNAGRVVQSFNDGWYYAACDDNRLQECHCLLFRCAFGV